MLSVYITLTCLFVVISGKLNYYESHPGGSYTIFKNQQCKNPSRLIEMTNSKNALHCAKICLQHANCHSCNFKLGSANQLAVCELLDSYTFSRLGYLTTDMHSTCYQGR